MPVIGQAIEAGRIAQATERLGALATHVVDRVATTPAGLLATTDLPLLTRAQAEAVAAESRDLLVWTNDSQCIGRGTVTGELAHEVAAGGAPASGPAALRDARAGHAALAVVGPSSATIAGTTVRWSQHAAGAFRIEGETGAFVVDHLVGDGLQRLDDWAARVGHTAADVALRPVEHPDPAATPHATRFVRQRVGATVEAWLAADQLGQPVTTSLYVGVDRVPLDWPATPTPGPRPRGTGTLTFNASAPGTDFF